jgi:hypothetical protein
MAGGSLIGSLRVALGLDSKFFSVGDALPPFHFPQSDGWTPPAFRAADGGTPAASQSLSNSANSDMSTR